MKEKINMNSQTEKELDRAQKQFDAYDDNIKQMTLDRMNMAPKLEMEPQTKFSSGQMRDTKEVYLKPVRTVNSNQKFNEDYRKQYEEDREYVRFVAENKEIIGETIDLWTRPYGGMPAEEWKVPVNKPVWGPKYLYKQIRRCNYHVMRSEQTTMTNSDGMGQYFGSMVADHTVPRLDANLVSDKPSFFMG